MMLVVCFVLFTGFVLGQHEHRCESPMSFEASVLQYDHLTGFYRKGRMFYDGRGQRIRMIEETAANQTRPSEDVLILFREKKEYVVDLSTRKCAHFVPRHQFHIIGVQDGYTLIGEYAIGSPPEDGLLLTEWHNFENSTEKFGVTTASFTKRDCLPYEHNFEGMAGDEKVYYRRRYFDIRVGEIHEDVFAVPKECATGLEDMLL